MDIKVPLTLHRGPDGVVVYIQRGPLQRLRSLRRRGRGVSALRPPSCLFRGAERAQPDGEGTDGVGQGDPGADAAVPGAAALHQDPAGGAAAPFSATAAKHFFFLFSFPLGRPSTECECLKANVVLPSKDVCISGAPEEFLMSSPFHLRFFLYFLIFCFSLCRVFWESL